MFDPLTQVYSNQLLTIWHKDPCKDGTDDSCGWTFPKITKEEKSTLEFERKFLSNQFLNNYKCWKKENKKEIVYTTYKAIKFKLTKKHLKQSDLLLIESLCFDIFDNLRIYESKQYQKNEDEFRILFYNIVRNYKRLYRKWHEQPRFHFWHWRIQLKLFRKLT